MDIFSIARNKGGAIYWTKDQLDYILKEYKNGSTIAKIASNFKVSNQTIRTLLRKNEVSLKGNKQNYPRNENYFQDINSEEKAYWLGFLYADGCVHSKGNAISISLSDREHLVKFQKAIGANNHKISTSIDKRHKKECTVYHFALKDKKMHGDLIKWGCIPQKSLKLTKIPNIPRDYISHFIRGYFDGDGSLHFLNGNKNFRFSLLGTKEFLEDIQKEIETRVSISYGTGKAMCFQISGRHQVPRVLNYLYKDSTENTRLDRKYNKYLECLEWVHRH